MRLIVDASIFGEGWGRCCGVGASSRCEKESGGVGWNELEVTGGEGSLLWSWSDHAAL